MDINEFLQEAKSINWFANSGKPNEKYRMVFSVFEAYDDWNDKMLKVWEPQTALLENTATRQIGDNTIDDIFDAVSLAIGDIIYKAWGDHVCRQHLEEETALDNEMMDIVKRDVSWACVERALNVKGFFSMLFEIYKEGYLPCAWIGGYPEGQAVVL